MVRVNVKWGKQTFEGVELDVSQPPSAFKELLQGLTGVPVARQKLMAKGAWRGMLKDSQDLAQLTIAEGAQLMLMGSAEVTVAPVEAVTFVEDMTEAEAAAQGVLLPAGLNNLGNTCYMNSTLQCLRSVPELREALRQYQPAAGASVDGQLVGALANMYAAADTTAGAYTPNEFVAVLRQFFPQFAEQGPGGWKQQDADELCSTVFQALSAELRSPVVLPSLGPQNNMLDALFGLEVEESLVCAEIEGDTPTTRLDTARKLICNIQGGAGSEIQINHLHEGILLGMGGSVEKHCEQLGRDAVYNITRRINRLPRYLCVQQLRFYWKATPNSADHEGVPCKSLRPVAFPTTLDVFGMCSPALQAVLRPAREAHAEALLSAPTHSGEGEAAAGAGAEAAAPPASTAGDVDMGEAGDDEEAAQLAAALALSQGQEPPAAPRAGAEESKGDDATVTAAGAAGLGLPANFMGNYELFAVVTHKGRSSSSGHYIGWAKNDSTPDAWYCFDDEEVSECRTDDITKLKGGGDWDMGYLCFYRFKN